MIWISELPWITVELHTCVRLVLQLRGDPEIRGYSKRTFLCDLLAFHLTYSGPWRETTLKVLANEKWGGLTMLSFDRSPFKLFSPKFSNKLVQAPSCERPKTARRTLFLSFEINNCIPISALCRAATHFSHHTRNWNNAIVHPHRYLRWR